MPQQEDHLDVFANRSELHIGTECVVFKEGGQDVATQARYRKICETFASGFLEKVLADTITGTNDYALLPTAIREKITMMVDEITSEQGRALVGLFYLQLAIKAIAPEQSIRLHKGGNTSKGFSWKQGISMRSLDKVYTCPFLRDHELLNLNKDGAMMTRSLAENYPYSTLYKAAIRGPVSQWIELIDAIEENQFDSKLALSFMTSLLQNRSEKFKKEADKAIALVAGLESIGLDSAIEFLARFFNSTTYAARALEVVMHALMQALSELDGLDGKKVCPLSQMRSANLKAGNIGDIELQESGITVEVWDAKYGKTYFWDELEELRQKLLSRDGVTVAGFVSNSNPDMRNDIIDRKQEIEVETNSKIHILSFSEWVHFQCGNLTKEQRGKIGQKWIQAVVESFGRRRLAIAPIDEPCDKWLADLVSLLSGPL